MKEFPTLYYTARTGTVHSWRVWSDGETVHTEYGLVGGKKQRSSKKSSPTNEGRSNMRTSEQQAEFDAHSLWTNKVERKYSETIEGAQEELFLPMLAHEFSKRGKNLSYPVHMQPKLDGVRCLAFWSGDQVRLLSRSGKDYDVPGHISKQVATFLPHDTVLDGELYAHGVSLQTITSWVKKLRPETARVEYHIYDIPVFEGEQDLPWIKRYGSLVRLAPPYSATIDAFKAKAPNVKFVNTGIGVSPEGVQAQERFYVSQGFEGAMVRTMTGLYEWGRRSPDLLKVKSFQDDEFEVVGFQDGVGRMEGGVVWSCKTGEGKTFSVTPKCSMENRKEFFRRGKEFVGRKLTVRFFQYTNDGLPQFPVGVGFRCEEDM